jgi:hypothetical protein
MNLIKVFSLVSLIAFSFSCSNKTAGKNLSQENIVENNHYQTFSQQDFNRVEMIYSMEYYKNEIIKYQDNYYGFKDVSMEITDIMNISSIAEVNNLIPNSLTFLVVWVNPKGYIYYLYAFNGEQRIVDNYYCGQFVSFKNYKILMEKLSGIISEYGTISIGDFNNNGINEIILYTYYPHIGNAFCVYEYNFIKKMLEELCLVPVVINTGNPFPSVEYVGNGFKILEVLDDELMEYAWNNYIWNNEQNKYIKIIHKYGNNRYRKFIRKYPL